MNAFLLSRASGSVTQTAFARAYSDQLVRSLTAEHSVSFEHPPTDLPRERRIAHPAAVNSIVIDKFEGRYLLSGAADASVAVWDLEETTQLDSGNDSVHRPLASVSKANSAHRYGVTHVAYYPFDSLAFLSSSYDHTVKLWSSETLVSSASFDLASVVYSFALSPIATHLLVACATQHQAVRLIDLRSGASTHSLAGHAGAVLAVAWHPKNEHELASGAFDGSLRLWDVRRSASSLASLDMNDSTGVLAGVDRQGHSTSEQQNGRAHNGPVNGLVWSDSGDILVSTGHDDRIRVWDAMTGANTMTNFGPAVKNRHLSTLVLQLSPGGLTSPGKDVLIYPNPRDLLISELDSGKLLSRLRVPVRVIEPSTGAAQATTTAAARLRTTSLAWRAHQVELYSAHSDGTIRCWRPRDAKQQVDEDQDDSNDEEPGVADRKRKRQDLQDIVEGLTKRKVTYT